MSLRLLIRVAVLTVFAALSCLLCYPQNQILPDVDLLLDSDSLLKFRAEVQEVNLILTITDHHRHFVQNLTPSDIAVQDNGESPEKITFFELQTHLSM